MNEFKERDTVFFSKPLFNKKIKIKKNAQLMLLYRTVTPLIRTNIYIIRTFQEIKAVESENTLLYWLSTLGIWIRLFAFYVF